MDLIHKINDLYDENTEENLISILTTLVGLENFRPKLDVIRELLSQDVTLIESFSEKVIVVAGTNGKGETCHNVRYLLDSQSKTTAMWSSPHVLSVCERMLFNNEPISYERLNLLVDNFKDTAIKYQLSFYEFLFFLFIKEVITKRPDYIILEVGLGGKFDAVNIFTNPLTAICSISKDHVQILGNSLKSILNEKFGIVRDNGVLLCAVEQKFLNDLISKWCKERNIELTLVQRDDDYSVMNQNTATSIVKQLGYSNLDKYNMWPVSKGRREKVTYLSRNFIFIGAHNLDGHRKMLKMLTTSTSMSRDSDILLLSFSTGREDQIEDILSLYDKSYPCLLGEKYLTEFSSPRAVKKDTLEKLLSDDFSLLDDWNIILDESHKNKNIYIVGSYFFISDFQRFIRSSK